MAKTLEGIVAFAKFEKADQFDWTDPKSGQLKPIRSLKVLLAAGDGTVSRESLTLPTGYEVPDLVAGMTYGFPVVASVARKTGKLSFTLIHSLKPFPAPEVN